LRLASKKVIRSLSSYYQKEQKHRLGRSVELFFKMQHTCQETPLGWLHLFVRVFSKLVRVGSGFISIFIFLNCYFIFVSKMKMVRQTVVPCDYIFLPPTSLHPLLSGYF
jgi:hypothetical protein